MDQNQKPKIYDLEERTLKFASDVRAFVRQLPKTTTNYEDVKQLVRSSGSIGANYIEANESLSKKDFYLRIKISRKEAKETRYWLKLIDVGEMESQRQELVGECEQLMRIFGSIVSNQK